MNDQLNPEYKLELPGSEKYFKVNRAPLAGRSLQEQVKDLLIGQEFEIAFSPESFSDPDETDTLTYSIEGLPEVLQFDGAQRLIKGKVDSLSAIHMVVKVTDPYGESA